MAVAADTIDIVSRPPKSANVSGVLQASVGESDTSSYQRWTDKTFLGNVSGSLSSYEKQAAIRQLFFLLCKKW